MIPYDPFDPKGDKKNDKRLWNKFSNTITIIAIVSLFLKYTVDFFEYDKKIMVYIIDIEIIIYSVIITIFVILATYHYHDQWYNKIKYRIIAIYYFNNLECVTRNFSIYVYDSTVEEICNVSGNTKCIEDKKENYNFFIKKLNAYKGVGIFTIDREILHNLIYEFTGNIDSFNQDCVEGSKGYIMKNRIFGHKSNINRFKKEYMTFINSYCKSINNIENKIGYIPLCTKENLHFRN